MNKLILLFILILCIQLIGNGQERFAKKAIEKMQINSFDESLDNINKYQEKEPFNPYGHLLRARWLSTRTNPQSNPDSAYDLVLIADGYYEQLKDTKENKNDLFVQYALFRDTELLSFIDSLAKMAYEKSLRINTIERFDTYYEKYRDFSYAKEAKSKAEHLRYLEVREKDKLEGYQYFVSNYPYAADVPEANYNIHVLAFERAKTNGTLNAFRQYISQFPKSHLKDNAWKEVYRLEFDLAINSNDVSNLENYLTSYPNSIYVEKIRTKLYEVAYQKVLLANKSQDCIRYRQKYPTSPFSDECYQLEMKLKWEELNQNATLTIYEIDGYLSLYPKTPFRSLALEQLAKLHYERVSDSEDPYDFIGFMNEFPESKEYNLAKQTAISLLANKATSLINQDLLSLAAEALDKILELDLNHTLSYYLYAHILKEQGTISEAISKLSTAIQLDVRNAEYLAQRGLYYIDYDQLGNAFQDLTKSISIDPSLPKANLGLGIIYDRKNEYSLAVNYYKLSLIGGYDVSDRIDYLESYIQQLRANQSSSASKSSSSTIRYTPKSSPKKNLLLPQSTIDKLKKSKK